MDDNQLDVLKFRNEKSVTKQLSLGEQILLSTALYKFNEVNKRQDRTLMITNQKIYNLNKLSITRKSGIDKVYAITISRLGSEFVIHIPDEYDYRYSSIEFRDQIIATILTVRGHLPLYFQEHIQLVPFTTTKIDKKKGICRQPTVGEQRMDYAQFKQYLTVQKELSDNIRSKTESLFARNKECKVALDDFHFLKVLGRGAFGKVSLAEKLETKELFAIKSLRKEDIKEEDQIQHVRTERFVLETVQHPFLVSLVYAFQTPDKLYFVTPFMKGGELFFHLRNSKRFSEQRSKFYTAELLLAIEYLHSKKILFRDLKLENILLDEFGHLKLTDYGLSKVLVKEKCTATLCGTPHYLAPEVLSELSYSFEIDWWALGVCLYEFLYGFPPFYSPNQDTMFRSIIEQPLAFPKHISVTNEAKDLMYKLLTKDRTKRIGASKGSEEIKYHPWFKGLNWAQLLTKSVEPPFVPKTQNDDWMSNFDTEFTSEEIINSLAKDVDFEEFKDWDF